MERQDTSQLELFSQSKEAQDFRANSANPFIERIRSYEKKVLVAIGVLVVGIVSFSLGVEKGKKMVAPELSQAIAVREAPVKPVATPVLLPQRGSLTIQVASFKTRANALKEAENIKRMGLSAILLTKGGYLILCAGNFPNKEAAQPFVAKLNKRYGNCQLRRL